MTLQLWYLFEGGMYLRGGVYSTVPYTLVVKHCSLLTVDYAASIDFVVIFCLFKGAALTTGCHIITLQLAAVAQHIP